MRHDQMVIDAGIIILIVLSLMIGGIAWAWHAFWNAYDKKRSRIPYASTRWAGQHAPNARRDSQTRGHV